MTKTRLEAFSDGVIAILITIMVLELHAPHGESLWDLVPLVPVFLSYVLSFIYIAIYWNNHHHLMQAVERVDGKILWVRPSFILAVARALRDSLDGGKQFRGEPRRALRGSAFGRRLRVFHPDASAPALAWQDSGRSRGPWALT